MELFLQYVAIHDVIGLRNHALENFSIIYIWPTHLHKHIWNKRFLCIVKTMLIAKVQVCLATFPSSYINTFAASYLNTQGLNNSCLKSPTSTLVELTFQSRALRSFSLNQLRNLSL